MDELIDKLKIEVSADVPKDPSLKINKIATALDSLKKASETEWVKLDEVISKINNFTGIDRNIGRGINDLAKGLERLQAMSFAGFASKIQSIASGLQPLQNISIGFTNISDFGRGINSLVNGIAKLQGLDLTGLSDKVSGLVKSITPLTDEMIRGGDGANNYGTQMLELAKATKIVNTEIKKTRTQAGGLTKTFAQMFGITKLWRITVRLGKEALLQSAQYTENLNLFSVTMGEATQKSLDFALNVANAYKVSSNEVIRYMGLFKQMSSAIGVAETSAIKISEALTLVAYDKLSPYEVTHKRKHSEPVNAGYDNYYMVA